MTRTGQFAAATASSTGPVAARGPAARNPDSSCSVTQAALHEVDMIAANGIPSF